MLPLLLQGQEGIDLDIVRCMKIGLVHDLAEALVGDITPHCGVSKEEKARREAEAMETIRASLPGSAVGAEIVALWHEYEDQVTDEAKLLKDLDKLEMIMQAGEYERAQGKDLSQFFESTAGKFTTPVGQAWEAEIVARRKKA